MRSGWPKIKLRNAVAGKGIGTPELQLVTARLLPTHYVVDIVPKNEDPQQLNRNR